MSQPSELEELLHRAITDPNPTLRRQLIEKYALAKAAGAGARLKKSAPDLDEIEQAEAESKVLAKMASDLYNKIGMYRRMLASGDERAASERLQIARSALDDIGHQQVLIDDLLNPQ